MKRGTRVGQAYVAMSVDGDGMNEDIVDEFDKAGPGIEKAGDDAGEGYADHFSEGFFARIKKKFGPQMESQLGDQMGDAGRGAGDRLGANLIDGLRDRLSQERDKIGDITDRILGDNGRSKLRMGRLTTALAASEKVAGELNKELIETLKLEQRIATAARGVSGNQGKNRRTGDMLGGFFGAGSRNNALNLFGKSIANIVNLTETLFMSLKRIPALMGQFAKGFQSAAEGASMFQRIGAGFGENGLNISKTFSALIASGPGAAVALVAVSVAMTVLVSVANALLAILVALTATIVSALVGALAVAATAFAVLAGAAGLTTLAFMSMTDAQKDMLSSAFKPLHEEAIGLGQVILRDLVPAFDQWSHNLQIALALVEPLAQIMGGALASAGSILSAALSGPGVRLFLDSLTQMIGGTSALNGIITHLSSALGGFINGLAGLFAAIVPSVLRFSEYLDRVAKRFSDWATSAKGQNAIKDFVDRALTSLNSLWNLVTAVGGLLSRVLFNPKSQSVGNNLFDRMADAVRRFTAYISQDNRLEKWLKEGQKFAIALAQAIKDIMRILQRLNSSGVIDGLAKLVDIGAGIYEFFSDLPRVFQDMLFPMQGIVDIIDAISGALGRASSSGQSLISTLAGVIQSANSAAALDTLLNPGGIYDPGQSASPSPTAVDAAAAATAADLQASGAAALAATSTDSGGTKVKRDPGQLSAAMQHYYDQVANAILANMPTYAETIKKALREATKTVQLAIKSSNTEFAAAIKDATMSADAAGVTSALKAVVDSQSETIRSTIESLKSNAASMVESAQSAVNSAAESLKSATTKSQAKQALAALAIAQDQLAQAEAFQNKINKRTKKLKAAIAAANAIASAQGVLNQANANALAQGLKVQNATLADYADARSQVAAKLEAANAKLQEAVALRDNFRTAVTDAVNAFAALTTAQAKTINGVEQALTANDITTNLQTKLDQIKKFQSNLHILLAQGLSQAAYKQLLDAGVEQGGAFAQALVNGGQGAVQQTNSLVKQIQGVADELGLEASDRLYQAGVAAAQGLVDGLVSLSDELNSAATALGNAIAAAIANALGIHSPSKVMFDYMRDGVGDGIAGGLDAARGKVGAAAYRLTEAIAISPEVAAYTAQQNGSLTGVSGNQPDPRFRDLVVHTPTENPKAVAMEVLNEVTGRL